MTAEFDCVFCDIVRGDAPAKKMADLHRTIVIVPRDPVTGDMPAGHLLVIPKTHVADFTIDDTVTAYTMRDAAWFARQLRRDYDGDWNLITSAGADATQTVFHLHVHLIRRIAGDGLALPWTGQHKPASEWATDPRNLFNL